MRLENYKICDGMLFRLPLSGKKFKIKIVPKKSRIPEKTTIIEIATGIERSYDEFKDIIVELIK